MNRIGKIIVQDKRYELVWNGGVSVERTHGNTIRIQTDIDVWLNNKKEAPKEYVMDVIGRAVKEFLYQDITPFALAGSSRKYKTKTFLVDIDNEKIVSPDKGLNDPTIIGDAPKEWLADFGFSAVDDNFDWRKSEIRRLEGKLRALEEEIKEKQKDIECVRDMITQFSDTAKTKKECYIKYIEKCLEV